MKPRQLKSGTWFIQAQVNGQRRSFSAPSEDEVLQKALNYKLTAKDAPSAPLGALIDRYIDVKKNVLSPSTITRYELTRRSELQRLMSIPVRELTSDRVQAEVNIMAADHSPKTVRNAYGLIRATLSLYAPEITLKVTLPQKKKVEYEVPTTEQVYDLIDHAGKSLKIAIMLAAFCGLRRGEIAALRAEDIKDGVIHVKSATVLSGGKQVDKAPKTFTSDRYVPAPGVLTAILPKRGKVCPLSLNSITHRFLELRDKLGYKCRFHDLRHYYASALHAIGIRDQYIMKFGGWKSDSILKSVYRGTLDDFETEAAEKANDYFERQFR